jgi:hypothetical protein
MPEHVSHGFRYVEPERHDELSDGVAAPVQAEAGGERRANGTWAKGARTAQSKGGKAMAGRGRALVHHGAASKGARALRRALRSEVASTVGGGVCGVASSLMIRWAADKTELAEKAKAAGDLDSFRKLTESARMDLLYAREHAAKEAAARPRSRADGRGLYDHLLDPVKPREGQ